MESFHPAKRPMTGSELVAFLRLNLHYCLMLIKLYAPFNSLFSRVSEQFLNGTSAHNRPFQCHLFSRTTSASRYQKGKTILDFNDARDSRSGDGSGIGQTLL